MGCGRQSKLPGVGGGASDLCVYHRHRLVLGQGPPEPITSSILMRVACAAGGVVPILEIRKLRLTGRKCLSQSHSET